MKRITAAILVFVMMAGMVSGYADNGGFFSRISGKKVSEKDKMVTCTYCDGTGTCSLCEGSGMGTHKWNSDIECIVCEGSGVCGRCAGHGKITKSQEEEYKKQDAKKRAQLSEELAEMNTPHTCSHCNGTGKKSATCAFCKGSGINPDYEASRGSVFHGFTEKSCPSCLGLGYQKCVYCNGTGVR